MLKRKKGLFSFLEGERYAFICDVCEKDVLDAEALRTYANTYAITIRAKLKTLCTACFNRGINHYRFLDFKYDTSNSNCAICNESSSVDIKDVSVKLRHLCDYCFKFKTHEDNAHSFTYSSDNNIWNSCSDCGTLRLSKNNHFSYWRIGSSQRQAFSSTCNKNNINQMLCKHRFINIIDTRNGSPPVSLKTVSDANRSLKRSLSALQNDPYPILTQKAVSIARNGYLLQWCLQCGFIEKQM